jgi:hypothetical protein
MRSCGEFVFNASQYPPYSESASYDNIGLLAFDKIVLVYCSYVLKK